MYLYGDEWGKAANVDALGLANDKVVRKLTIFADDVLVKQYLQDVMGPEFDADEVFCCCFVLLCDYDTQNQQTTCIGVCAAHDSAGRCRRRRVTAERGSHGTRTRRSGQESMVFFFLCVFLSNL